CMKLTHELGKRIVYDPDVMVYHHRREIFAGHLKQIKSYALHRGFFARKFPKTSLRLSYFVPSLFVLFFFFGWLSIFLYPPSFKAWIFIMCIYIFPVLLSAIRSFHSGGFFGIVAGTFLTHITYGIWFIIGLFSHDLFD
ncbi:MAG: hypothetical protein JXB48_20015, partial [Candidatus Latescibacteria bacterium]|nr:hypothetical protein [Candidatus Latescibacterota bacterium]